MIVRLLLFQIAILRERSQKTRMYGIQGWKAGRVGNMYRYRPRDFLVWCDSQSENSKTVYLKHQLHAKPLDLKTENKKNCNFQNVLRHSPRPTQKQLTGSCYCFLVGNCSPFINI